MTPCTAPFIHDSLPVIGLLSFSVRCGWYDEHRRMRWLSSSPNINLTHTRDVFFSHWSHKNNEHRAQSIKTCHWQTTHIHRKQCLSAAQPVTSLTPSSVCTFRRFLTLLGISLSTLANVSSVPCSRCNKTNDTPKSWAYHVTALRQNKQHSQIMSKSHALLHRLWSLCMT